MGRTIAYEENQGKVIPTPSFPDTYQSLKERLEEARQYSEGLEKQANRLDVERQEVGKVISMLAAAVETGSEFLPQPEPLTSPNVPIGYDA